MRRSLALAFLLTLLGGGSLRAQALDDVLVPRGRVQLQMFPVFTSWDSRFGRAADGTTGEEDLGEDLTSTSAASLFPGTASLVSAIESMSGLSGYTPVLGETTGRVTRDVTRVEFGGHIGIFDWLTIGAKLPWSRTRTNVDLVFRPDTLTGDLGLNPLVSGAGSSVSTFLQSLSAASAAASANASSVCGSSPGSAACTSAQDLAARTDSFASSATTAYGSTPFFPVSGSAAAGALGSAASSLSADLTAAGLPGIGSMVFASQWIGEDELATVWADPAFGIGAPPVGDVVSLWHAGDLEVTASVRLLEGALQDSAATTPRLSWRLIGTFLTRLPTGAIDNPDVFLDVGTGDGQTDFEGRLLGEVTLGRRLGIRAAGRYGIQLPRTLERRVVPPEQVLAPLASRQLVEWDPGSYFGLEVAPVYRFAPELSLGAEYRVYRKYRDTYTLAGASVGAPVDPVVMQVESGVTVHHIGGVLRYDNVARRMQSGTGWPLQLHLRVLRAFQGGGGQTPVTTHLEFGLSFFRRFWGAP